MSLKHQKFYETWLTGSQRGEEFTPRWSCGTSPEVPVQQTTRLHWTSKHSPSKTRTWQTSVSKFTQNLPFCAIFLFTLVSQRFSKNSQGHWYLTITLLQIFHRMYQWKNFENWSIFVKVIEWQSGTFFKHSVYTFL